MQLHISIRLASPLALPINYNHIQQAAVYNLLSGEEGLSDFAHDEGYTYDGKTFRMFCFSPLKGNYCIDNKSIIFTNRISFEVRSNNNLFIIKMEERLRENGIRLGNAEINSLAFRITDIVVRKDTVRVHMKSPVTVITSDVDTGEKVFIDPDDDEFYLRMEDNFIRKYTAYYGGYPAAKINMYPTKDSAYKKFVTYVNRAPLVGWYGDFILKGDPGHISFLYNSGIGNRNAQGFGMFDLADEV